MRLFLAGTVCLAAAAAQAQTQTEPEGPTIIGVTDVKVCDTIAAAAPENKLFDAIQSDTMVLLLEGMEAIEYNCVFDGEIQVDPTMTMRQTFPGPRRGPGPCLAERQRRPHGVPHLHVTEGRGRAPRSGADAPPAADLHKPLTLTTADHAQTRPRTGH